MTREVQAAAEERCGGPEHHRAREGELQVHGERLAEPGPERQSRHGSHGEHEQGQRQGDAQPQASGEVGELVIGLVADAAHRFQGHAADRARPRLVARDLRVHGAAVADVRRRIGRHAAVAAGPVEPRIGGEALPAAAAAEVVVPAPVAVLGGGRRRGRHGHAADRIDSFCRSRARVLLSAWVGHR